MIKRPLHGFACIPAALALAIGAAWGADPAAGQPDEAVLFDQMPVVEAASLHTQPLKEAPASITLITEEDIRRFGYRTLGEALADVRGFYIQNDRNYRSLGVRGFALPGDYNTRVLVMINGHYMTDNIYSANDSFGQDFGLDMDLVKRIEIIRGPTSALYGSNGVLATINIVVKSPVEMPAGTVSAEIGSLGEKKITAMTSLDLGHGANALIAGSLSHDAGQDLYFPEYDSPETGYGWARNADAERAYHTFASLTWRNWQFTTLLSGRDKVVPTGAWGAIFGDRGNHSRDDRSYFEGIYSRDLRSNISLEWRGYYDNYRSRGRYDFASDGGILDNRDLSQGDWLGSRISVRMDFSRLGALTVGGEVNSDLRNVQSNFDSRPVYHSYLHVNRRDSSYGLFAQQELELSRNWKAYAGLRFDDSRNHLHFLSPRFGVVRQIGSRTTLKMLYGRVFRNPNAYEMFYDDSGVSQIANPRLKPEDVHTFEFDAEHKVGSRWVLSAGAYAYLMNGLIQAVTVEGLEYEGLEIFQFQNLQRTSAKGLEVEADGRTVGNLRVDASLAVQQTTLRGGGSLAVSPGTLTRVRVTKPFNWAGLAASGTVRYTSSMLTREMDRLRSFWVADADLSTTRLSRYFDVVFGVRNLFNRRYFDPVGWGLRSDRLQEDGRSVFVKFIWRTSEQPHRQTSSTPGRRAS